MTLPRLQLLEQVEPLPNAVAPAVRLSGVSKVYKLYGSPRAQLLDQSGLYRVMFWRDPPQFREFHALRDIDITINKGERVGVVGRNGAGKTTLLKLITGNFTPTSGCVEVDGSVQALMQLGVGFHPDFSGYDNIKAALSYNGLAGEEFEEALQDVIEFVELGDFLHQPMKTYSLGMNARLQFAAATAIRPDILIIDEIMGAGDGYFAAKSAHRMHNLTRSGCTLLLVSHSISQVLQFCEKAIWIHEGSVRQSGSALEVVKEYEEFIAELTQRERAMQKAAVQISLAEPERTSQRDYATPLWQRDQLASLLTHGTSTVQTMAVSDQIPSGALEQGLKIARVEVFDEHGKAVGLVSGGRPMTIEVELVTERTDEFTFQLVLVIMTLEGVGVARHLSEPFRQRMRAGDRYVVCLHYDRILLAKGEFAISAAAFRHYDPDHPPATVGYDLLSRCFRLRVVPIQQSEPAVLNHPGRWEALPKLLERA